LKIRGKTRAEVREAVAGGDVTISVYGLGKIGLPVAAVFASRGARVIGVDVNQDVVEKVNSGENPIPEEPGLGELLSKTVELGRLSATVNGIEAAASSDVMIVCVPTLVNELGVLNDVPLRDAFKSIAKGLKRDDVVIVESTMPPGATEKQASVLEALSGLKTGVDFGVAHAPERVMTGSAIADMTVKYPKIVGASDPATLEAVAGLYEAINRRGVVTVSSIRAAEAVKVFEGVYRDVNIALANELAAYAEANGLDVMEIISAANTQPYCHIHRPGAGVGGHCIPVYPYFLISTAAKQGLEMRLVWTARKINEAMPGRIVCMTIKALNIAGRPVKGAKILVLGLTYRPGVREYRNSPAKPIIDRLKALGARVYAYDPVSKPEDYRIFGVVESKDFRDADAVVIVTDHDEFRRLDLDVLAKEMRTKVIVDGRRVLNPVEAIKRGFTYLGVGYSPSP